VYSNRCARFAVISQSKGNLLFAPERRNSAHSKPDDRLRIPPNFFLLMPQHLALKRQLLSCHVDELALLLNGVLKLAALNPERVRAVAELVPLLEESKHEPEERKRR